MSLPFSLGNPGKNALYFSRLRTDSGYCGANGSRLAAVVAFLVVYFAAAIAAGRPGYQPAGMSSAPHPAVARVVAPERNGTAYGSGTLVEVNDLFGIVVTNWHVVRDAAGQVGVIFPDGFRSAATVLRVDRDWDLAALVIWRPNVRPVPLSSQVPRPGEMLTIAGYGSGSYRAVSGRCTQFLSPGGNYPFELVELAAPARDGDSGGPILNSRGELAGVLFGSAFGKTTGSHCGRLSAFLGSVAGDFRHLTSREMLARQKTGQPAPLASISGVREQREADRPSPPPSVQPRQPLASVPAGLETSPSLPEYSSVPVPPTPAIGDGPSDAFTPASAPAFEPASTLSAAPPAVPSSPSIPPPPPQSFADRIKTILAAIGLIAVAYCSLRLLGWVVG